MTENELYFGQDVTENKYVQTKFQAEELVLYAVGKKFLDAKIIRVGNLMSRVSDGKFRINSMTNAFMMNLRGYATIGKFPVTLMDEEAEISPIDSVAAFIIKLAATNKDFTVFHADLIHSAFLEENLTNGNFQK